jgi:uncharacterized protein DUF1036
MRGWTSALIAACVGLGIGLSVPAQSQPAPSTPAPGPGGGAPGGAPGASSTTVTVNVCNTSGVKSIFMAFVSLKDSKTWHVHGWYTVPDTGCAKLGDFPKDTLYYFAVDKTLQTTWTGDATQQCVNTAIAFDYNQPGQGNSMPPHQCAGDEVMVGFEMIKTTSDAFKLTLQ